MYSEQQIKELFDKICLRISNGSALRDALKEDGMPDAVTFYKWLKDEVKLKQYARATETRAELIFDEMMSIADTPIEGVVIETDDNGRTKEKKGDMLGHRRLQIDARKWILSKMNPKKYGDKVDVTTGDQPINSQNIILTKEQIDKALEKY